MGSSGPLFDLACMLLHTPFDTFHHKLLPSRTPNRGLNAIITQALTSIPLLFD